MSKGSPIVTVRLSPPLLKHLQETAQALGIPVSDVIRDAIKAYLPTQLQKNG